MRRWVFGTIGALAVIFILGAWANGWETSVSKGNRIAGEHSASVKPNQFQFQGGELKTKVVGVFYDATNNVSAVVVEVTNPDKKRPIVYAPIEITLLDKAGKAVGKNTAPGTDPSLNEIPSIGAGETVLYVNDAIVPSGPPASAEVKATGKPTDQKLDELTVANTKVESGIYGVSATGQVLNPGAKTLKNVLVEAVVKKGDAVVAAGTAQVKQLDPNAPEAFQIFLIGDAKGGKLDAWAPAR